MFKEFNEWLEDPKRTPIDYIISGVLVGGLLLLSFVFLSLMSVTFPGLTVTLLSCVILLGLYITITKTKE